MKRYTQKEFDGFPVIGGAKQCPTGDYTAVDFNGARSSIGARSNIGAWSHIGEGSMLEDDKALIGDTVFCVHGFGSRQASLYGIPTAEGVYIRCGCYAGWLADFREEVATIHECTPFAEEYRLAADLFELKWKRLAGKSEKPRKKPAKRGARKGSRK